MDKTEYRMRLDEITKLVDAQDYEGALELVDAIDWRRVKSVRTLCMVAEIYEINGELEESMKMLQLAYKRSSVGKMILYRQVELALKMGAYDDAVRYYNQYLETASNDTSKYILKYKIYKAQNAPLEDQISILEEYKDREYTERWVYELARLYQKAGKQNKCVETCDDLILWFGEGKYVTKAMEMKMSYTPLTAAQQEKYDKTRKPVTTSRVQPVKMPELNTDIPEPQEKKAEAEAAAQRAQEERAREVAATEEPPIPHVDLEALQERLNKSFQEVLSGFNRTRVVDAFEALGRSAGSEVPKETVVEEDISNYQVTDLEPEPEAGTPITADKGAAIAHRTEMPKSPKKEVQPEEKPEDKEAVSIQELDLEALFSETSLALAEAAGSAAAESDAEDVTTVEASETIAEDTAAAETAEIEEDTTAVESAAIEVEEAEAAEESSDVEAMIEAASAEVESVNSDDADMAMAAFEASLAALDIGGQPEEAAVEAVADDTMVIPQISLPKEDTSEADVESIGIETIGAEEEAAAEEPETSEMDLPEITLNLELPEEEDAQAADTLMEEPEALESEEPESEEPESEAPEIEEAEPEAVVAPEEEIRTEQKEEDFNPMLDLDIIQQLESEHEEERQQMAVPERETPEEKRYRILNATRPEHLTNEQKNLFSYFAKVPGMDEQILDAINGAYQYAGEKTSRRGNIAIMGSHGTGKTRLSEGLIKAICKQFGLEAAKYANLDASDMNQRDPATVIAKMAGGFLLIERASFMNEETVQKLSQAMDFRTDSMILIIEDDKANMRKFLAEHPKFAEKFATVISIPVFTNDELVTFARTYAKENGYRMDEMGVLALYTLIGNNQRADEPITIGKVKEMVDEAISRASSSRLGRRLSKRRTDEDGRILLYEKDFDM